MAVNGDDKAAIEMRQTALQETYSKVMEATQAEQHQAQSNQGNTSNAANDARSDDDIIDADFEEVSNG